MDKGLDAIQKMQAERGHEKIQRLQDKIDTTQYNIEVSEEIIAETPSDAHREKLTQKNIRRRHGIAGLEKEIRDTQQTLEH